MQYPTCVKLPGTATTDRGTVRRVACFVRYIDPLRYDQIVSDYFQYYQRIEIESYRKRNPDHFTSPRNIAVSILTYYYFRAHGELFSDSPNTFIDESHLPNRSPDASDHDFSLWVDDAPDIEPPPKPELTQLKWK